MDSKQKTQALLGLRDWIVKATNGCHIQGGWPCNTCTHYLLEQLGASKENAHNFWLTILEIREPSYDTRAGLPKEIVDNVFKKAKVK